MLLLEVFALAAGLSLLLALIWTLVRGGYKSFPFLFAYVCASFLTIVFNNISLVMDAGDPAAGPNVYSSGLLVECLKFGLVMSLLEKAGMEHHRRRLVRRLPTAVGSLALLALFLHRSAGHPPGWAALLERDIGLSAALVNVVLWLLLANRGTKTQLLFLSGGLVVQMAGDAVAGLLRRTAPWADLPAYLLIITAHLACLLIWYSALRRPAEGRLPRRPAPAQPREKSGLSEEEQPLSWPRP